MFTGIIENIGEIIKIENDMSNFNIIIKSNFSHHLSIGESVAHNGVCLTVTHIDNDLYKVNCVKETLSKTNNYKTINKAHTKSYQKPSYLSSRNTFWFST